MSEPLLVARNVTKMLGTGAARVRALNNISFSLKEGELTVLMGPSGSGKTTLLSVLGCMLLPTEGSVQVCGQPTDGAGAEELADIRRRHVGFVFQSYYLFPTLTAAENIRLALDVRSQRGRAAAAKTTEALRKVGLSHKAKAFPRELSGGEQQRVAIARAIVAEPSVILADEPTAALDGSNGQAVMKILASIAGEPGRAVLVVTHDKRVANFAERIVHMEDGRLIGEQQLRSTMSIGYAPRENPEPRLEEIAPPTHAILKSVD